MGNATNLITEHQLIFLITLGALLFTIAIATLTIYILWRKRETERKRFMRRAWRARFMTGVTGLEEDGHEEIVW
ncbi:hypothetical protein CI109_101543 [Kwoniella shandongensis]|uniref:Uncharacterized protein n=1 Tax=Kwoniella shandongensis TaxID=1734106 RepID=A0A5M6C6R5_9TREE|nr:uncharacterized protein CI109_001325 [Kwoniella shandongensis]KAA5530521.1 hypothetical protein CI109_001325 [Kwoniella shandongensis]